MIIEADSALASAHFVPAVIGNGVSERLVCTNLLFIQEIDDVDFRKAWVEEEQICFEPIPKDFYFQVVL